MTSQTPTAPTLVRPKQRKVVLTGDRPLMGATEAAAVLGVKQTNLRELSGLPEPFMKLACGTIWLSADIQRFKRWRKTNPPKPGPKPKSVSIAA
jgi:hypothetical protein